MALHWAFNPLGIGGLAPYPGERGVLLMSSSITVSAAMVMRDAGVGPGFPGLSMYAYNKGSAVNPVAVSGGTVYISSGGSATNADFAGGSCRVYAGGTLTNITTSSGASIVVTGEGAHLSGGTAYGRLDSTADVATVSTRLYVQSGGLIEDLVLDGTTSANTGWAKAGLYVLNGGIASNIHAMGSSYYGGSITVSSGGSAVDCEMNRYGFYIFTGGTVIRPIVSQATGHAQLYAYGGATVYDLRNLRGTTSAHSGSYISGGVVSGGTLLEWGSATGITISAYKNGTANVRGSLDVRHGTTVSASSAHVGTATDIINKGGVVWIYGGTLHTLMIQPDLEATNLGGSGFVRNHVNNAIVAEDRVGYLTDVVVSGAPTAGGVRSWLYISSGGVVSGATMYASGCIAVSSGGRIEDLHISNNNAGYAFSMTSGASANNVYRVGSHGSNGTGMAVALIDRGAEVTNLYNSGGGAPYSLLNRGVVSGYYGSAVLNGGTIERSYLYNQSNAELRDVYIYGTDPSIANIINHAAYNLDGYVSHVEVTSGAKLQLTLSCGASAYNISGSAGGWAFTAVSSGCLLDSASGCVTAFVYAGGTATNVLWDEDASITSNPYFFGAAGAYISNVVVKGSDYRGNKLQIRGSADDIGCYGGAPSGQGVVLQVYSTGVARNVHCGPYSGAATCNRVYGSAYEWNQSGGWLYINYTNSATNAAYLSGGTLTVDDTHSAYHTYLRIYTNATVLNYSTLATENTSRTVYVDVSSGGLAKDTYQVGGQWRVLADGVVSNHVLSGGGRLAATGITSRTAHCIIFSGGSAYNISAIALGRDSDNQVNRCWIHVSSGGYLSGAYCSGYGSALVVKGGTITDLVAMGQADIYGSLGIASNYIVINLGAPGITGAHGDYIVQYAGRTRIHGGATGDATLDDVYLSGGTVWVWQNGTVSSGTIDRGTNSIAVMMVSSGGVAYNVTVKGGELQLQTPSLVSNTTAVNSGIIHISSGGVASTAIISSGGSCIVSSGGQLYDVTVASSGTLQILDGADTVSNVMVLPAAPTTFVSLYAAPLANLYSPLHVSGAQAHLACTIDNIYVCSAGVVVASNGCNIMGGTITDANTALHVSSGAVMESTLVATSAHVYVSSGGSAQYNTVSGTSANTAGLYAYGGALVTSCSVYAGGYIQIYTGGSGVGLSALSPGVSGSGAHIFAALGGTLESCYCSGLYGRIYVYSSAYGSHLECEAGCEGWVYGSADDLLASGCTCVAQNGGIINSAVAIQGFPTMNRGGFLLARSGTIISAICSSGGNVHVSAGGLARQITVLSSGNIAVSSGGSASGITNSGGAVVVSSGGILSDITIVSNGLLTANDGAEVYGITASAATDLTAPSIQLSPLAMAYGTITVNHARAHLAGTIESFTASNSAIVVAKDGCAIMDGYVEGYDTELRVESGATVDTLWVEGAGKIYISAGGVVSATDAHQVIGTATVSDGGYLHIGEYAYFEYFVCLSGGTVYVANTAEYDDYESEPGAVIIWGD